MARHTALRIAMLCGMLAFGWAMLTFAPPPAQSPARTPPMPDHPDELLQWLAEGHGDGEATAWRHAGEIFAWRGERAAAMQAWRRAARLARHASGGWGQYTLAWSLARLGDPGAAEQVALAVEQSRQRDAEGGPSWQRALSRAALLQLVGDAGAAEQELELARLRLAAEGGPADAEALFGVARSEALRGRPEMALAALQRAAETGERVRRVGRARWAFEFGELRDDPRFQRAIDRLERARGALRG